MGKRRMRKWEHTDSVAERWWKSLSDAQQTYTLRWIGKNPLPEGWRDTRIAYAYLEMPVLFNPEWPE